VCACVFCCFCFPSPPPPFRTSVKVKRQSFNRQNCQLSKAVLRCQYAHTLLATHFVLTAHAPLRCCTLPTNNSLHNLFPWSASTCCITPQPGVIPSLCFVSEHVMFRLNNSASAFRILSWFAEFHHISPRRHFFCYYVSITYISAYFASVLVSISFSNLLCLSQSYVWPVRFQVLTAERMKMTVFWDAAP
jgi:hypothetical protein